MKPPPMATIMEEVMEDTVDRFIGDLGYTGMDHTDQGVGGTILQREIKRMVTQNQRRYLTRHNLHPIQPLLLPQTLLVLTVVLPPAEDANVVILSPTVSVVVQETIVVAATTVNR